MTKKKQTIPVLVATFLLFCGFATPASALSQKINDPSITRAVQELLTMDQGAGVNDIHVMTAQKVVTLSGTVNNLLASDRAREIAESIKGVRAVINTLKVVPPARTDAEIQKDVMRALVSDPATATREIQVAVSSGEVHLAGAVEYWREKHLVESVAEGVRGVRHVQDDLRILYPHIPSDGEIGGAVHDRLASDALVLNGQTLKVRVDHGNVFLSGVVGSASSRWQAGLDGWVGGVMDVDIAGIVVRDEGIRQMIRTRASLYYQPDAKIRESILAALREDPRVHALQPTVLVQNGQVTLTGMVDHLQAKVAAGRDAVNTIGVLQVNNLLKVQRPNPRPDDAAIATGIKEAWARDPSLYGEPLVVSVLAGDATLQGVVLAPSEKTRARGDASQVRGVLSVINEVTVSSLTNPVNDQILADNVENRLFWNPFVSGQEIRVTVQNGVVKLEGTVGSATESGAAELAAEAAGARRVDNFLVVVNNQWSYPSSSIEF